MNAQSTRARRHRNAFSGLEALESRQLLTSDLAVSFNNDNFRAPSILVPGDRFLPDTAITAPIRITNNGPMAADGKITISFYLSQDSTLNPTTDPLIQTFADLDLSLDASGANAVGTFEPDMRLPSSAEPGTYFILVRIVSSSAIGDSNAANDFNVSPSSREVRRAFGTVGTRSNVSTVIRANDGTLAAFSLTGGGSGTVSINSASGAFTVAITGSGQTSDFSITTSAGTTTGASNRIDLASLTIATAIRDVTAPTTRIASATTLNLGSSFRNVSFGDVTGPFAITVLTSNAPSSGDAPSFSFANVTDLNVNSALGLSSFRVSSWLDTDSTADQLIAPWIVALSSTGNIEFNLQLTGGAPSGVTLNTATIGGVVKDGAWSVNGPANAVTFFASTINWSASFSDRLTTFASTTGTIRGYFTARSFGSITSGKNIVSATILAGPFLGADGRVGGTGADADSFRPGQIGSVTVANGVANSTIAAGLADIPGAPGSPTPRQLLGGTNSRIGDITVRLGAGPANRFLANRYGVVSIAGSVISNPLTDTLGRFQLNTLGPVVTVSIVSPVVVLTTGAAITLTYTSYNVMALSTIAASTVLITGPNGFSRSVSLTSRAFKSGSAQGAVDAVFALAAPTWTSADNGTYTVSLQAPLASDIRGNLVLAQAVGTFNVNIV